MKKKKHPLLLRAAALMLSLSLSGMMLPPEVFVFAEGETTAAEGETLPPETQEPETQESTEQNIAAEQITVTGEVLYEDGRPAAGAEVTVKDNDAGTETSLTTDWNGKYLFQAVKGGNYTILAATQDGYQSDPLTVTGLGSETIASLLLRRKQFSVTLNISNSEGGSVDGQQGDTIAYGESYTCHLTANEGYCISKLLINEEEVQLEENASSYDLTIPDIRENKTVEVTFEKIVYTLTINVSKGGEIRYEDGETYEDGDNVVAGGGIRTLQYESGKEVTILPVPAEGYRVSKIEVDTDSKSYTENTPAEEELTRVLKFDRSHTYRVEFSPQQFHITLKTKGNGSTYFDNYGSSGDFTVNYGDDLLLHIQPQGGYSAGSFTVNGEEKSEILENSENGMTAAFTNVTEDMALEVLYLKNEVVDVSKNALQNDYYTLTFSEKPVRTDTDSKTNITTYVLPKDANAELKAAEGWRIIKIDDTWCGEDSIEINATQTIRTLDMVQNGTPEITLGVRICILIDNVKPQINVPDKNAQWTNSTDVTITGTATDQKESSGLSHVVWGIGVPLSDTEIKAGKNKKAIDADGNFTIHTTLQTTENEDGTTTPNATHFYLYALDAAGNASGREDVYVNYDGTAPTITSFRFSNRGDSVSATDIGQYQHGNYSKNTVYLFVGAKDAGVSSGLSEVILYLDGKAFTSKEITNGTAVFELSNSDFAKGRQISAVVTDRAGNASKRTAPQDLNASVSNFLRITDSVPTAAITTEEPVFTDQEGRRWYAEDTVLTVSVQDAEIPISEVQITLNGTLLSEDSTGVLINDTSGYKEEGHQELQFTISTDQIEPSEDGSYTLHVSAVNAVGTVSEERTETVYVDRDEPMLIGFTVTPVERNVVEKVIRFLTFGIFFKDQVEVTVSAADPVPSSGINTITLYVDDEVWKTETANNGVSTFRLPAEMTEEGTLAFEGSLSASAADFTGHSAQPVMPGDVDPEISSSFLMVESARPVIRVTADLPADDRNPATADANDWYCDDIGFTVNVSDADSGIANVHIYINDQELTQDLTPDAQQTITEDFTQRDKKVNDLTFLVSTSQAEICEDGSYLLRVTAEDNAGNEAEVYEQTVYKDTTAPEIAEIRFNSTDGSDELSVQSEVYGYYFLKDTEVTIRAWDAVPSSGVRSVSYYTVDKDGGQSEEHTGLVNADGELTFTVKANFKGQVYAKAQDNVGNETAEYVTPDGVIVESGDKHQQEEHIAFSVPQTDKKTHNGEPLYKADVDIGVTVTDTYSGLQEVSWRVEAPHDPDGGQSGSVFLNKDGSFRDGQNADWKATRTDRNLVTEMQRTIRIGANSNGIVLHVAIVDNAGNRSESSTTISIDKTIPTISVAYNDVSSNQDGFYREDRVATITVQERNFDAGGVDLYVHNEEGAAPSLSGWTAHENADDPDKSTYTATLVFHDDGNYEFDMRFTDMAGNEAVPLSMQKFIIDQTSPDITIAYDNNDAANSKYYKQARTATITIIEHNFDAELVTLNGTTDGRSGAFPAVGEWKERGKDSYSATISFTSDAQYSFSISCSDKAGNAVTRSEKEFVIDTLPPQVEIGGVSVANKDVVAPEVRVKDTNFTKNTVTITLKGANNKEVEYPYSTEDIAGGQQFVWEDFAHTKQVDDIYILEVSLTDLAGNVSTQSMRFSANRFGSVYDLSAVSDYIGKYLTKEPEIVVVEINADSLKDSSTLLRMTKNGAASDLVRDADYTIEKEGGGSDWSSYRYILNPELFAEDGSYLLSFYSEDAAGNINENIDENKGAEIAFGIDKTQPVIVPVDIESKKQYAEESKTASIEIKDNLVLQNVKMYLDDVEVEYTVEGETYTLSIPESNSSRILRILATDAAGNEMEMLIEDFLVTTNPIIRWFNNKPLFIGSLSGVGVLIMALIVFLLFGRKKKSY